MVSKVRSSQLLHSRILEKLPSSEVQGAIVLYDWRHYTQYGLLSGPFRGNGANHAMKHGSRRAHTKYCTRWQHEWIAYRQHESI